MREARAVAALVAAQAACAPSTTSTPSPGPGGGSVSVEVSGKPSPGTQVLLDLDAKGEDVGSAFVTLDRWDDGVWRASWWYVRSSDVAHRIPDDEEASCPEAGIALPARMVIDVPVDLGSGTWRVAWVAGEDEVGGYVFEVG